MLSGRRMCSQVLACALLQELGASPDGVECGELAAFCVHPSYRGSGRGDSLLDYVEQRARDKGIRRLVRSNKKTFSSADGSRHLRSTSTFQT